MSEDVVYERARDYLGDEPRLEMIRRLLQSILREIDPVDDRGRRLGITGFRLRRPADWVTCPAPNLLDSLGSLSPACNCDCEFCYQRGNPFPSQRGRITMPEIRARLRHYDPQRKRAIFLRASTYFEPLCNPRLMDILEQVRERAPDEEFLFTTNGVLLTEEVIRGLARFKPVHICLSLNSVNPQWRREAMRDPRPGTAIAAPELLRRHGIPFTGSIVAWPSLPADDFRRTVAWLDRWEAHAIRVNLPGHSRFFHPPPPPVGEAFWRQVVDLVEQIRPGCRSPLCVQPALFVTRHNRPVLEGVIGNSPAAGAGLRRGDEVVCVDGRAVTSRPHAMQLLEATPPGPEAVRQVEVVVDRAGDRLTFTLRDPEPGEDRYPYRPAGFTRGDPWMGAYFVGGFDPEQIAGLEDVVRRWDADRALVMASRLMRPLFEAALETGGSDWLRRRVVVITPENRYLGGSIFMGDLWQVTDLIAAFKDYADRSGTEPDLVVVPSSFTCGWGRDLCGDSFLELERATGVPVALFPCERIYI